MQSENQNPIASSKLADRLERFHECPYSLRDRVLETLSDRAVCVQQKNYDRLFILPPEFVQTTTVFIASSRLGRSLENKSPWFDALRTAAIRLADGQHSLLTGSGTTSEKYVRRIAQLWGYRLLELEPLPKKLTQYDVDTLLRAPNTIFFGPAIKAKTFKLVQGRPAIDFPLSEFADLMIVLRASNKGTVRTATLERLRKAKDLTSLRTQLLVDSSLTKPKTTSELLEHGVTGWWLYREDEATGAAMVSTAQDSNTTEKLDEPTQTTSQIKKPHAFNKPALEKISLQTQSNTSPPTAKPFPTRSQASSEAHLDRPPSLPPNDRVKLIADFDSTNKPVSSKSARFPNIQHIDTSVFLSHWTRERFGKWPDQTEEDYLDDLIFCDNDRLPTGFNTLCRIAASMKILGSATLTKSKQPVVCWTEVPLENFPQRRIFRNHLARWDFELYGIAINKDLIARRGGRPVIYGSPKDWQSFAPADEPFFQLAQSADKKIDWTAEKEWRTLGHFDLKQIGANDGLLFVPSQAEAAILEKISRWPIAVFE